MRPFLTVGPLADDLGLEINLDCERDDAACVRAVVKEFTRRSTKDVLICWVSFVFFLFTHVFLLDRFI